MNPLSNVKSVLQMNKRELDLGLAGTKTSWHNDYKESAWIFIGGLPYELTEGDLICVFSQYGEVVNINLVRDKDTGKFKGYGFLCYEDQRSTVLAVDNLNGSKLLGRTIRADHVKNYRRPKEFGDEDEVTALLRAEGCAPLLPETQIRDKKLKKKKKEKKKKKRSVSTSGDDKPGPANEREKYTSGRDYNKLHRTLNKNEENQDEPKMKQRKLKAEATHQPLIKHKKVNDESFRKIAEKNKDFVKYNDQNRTSHSSMEYTHKGSHERHKDRNDHHRDYSDHYKSRSEHHKDYSDHQKDRNEDHKTRGEHHKDRSEYHKDHSEYHKDHSSHHKSRSEKHTNDHHNKRDERYRDHVEHHKDRSDHYKAH